MPLAAILAGIGIKAFFPEKRLKEIKKEIGGICYGLFVPIFFFWVGIKLDVFYLLVSVSLILLISGVSSISKIISSIIACRGKFGIKK